LYQAPPNPPEFQILLAAEPVPDRHCRASAASDGDAMDRILFDRVAQRAWCSCAMSPFIAAPWDTRLSAQFCGAMDG
jgi:hypothetical protein